MKNAFFYPEELGYIYDDQQNLQIVDYEETQNIGNKLYKYAPHLYIIEDKTNLFKKFLFLLIFTKNKKIY